VIIIAKANIEYFRSLKKTSIKDLNHLNVFSGKNDIGKSNVLKALDTFFNKAQIDFNDDFNKERLTEVRQVSVKGKQFIKITIEFVNPGSYKTLPDRFTVSKSWDRQGNLIEGHKDNFEALVRRNKIKTEDLKKARTSLTKFLNKIRYTYVPAIRDENFFAFLLNKLQETIFEVEERKRNQTFQTNISSFNRTIGNLTTSLNEEFQRVSGISSTLSFPTNVSEIFQRLIIDTSSGDHNIPLRLRGDGIRLRYIPTILNYISEHSKYFECWGFDEPENSCEYSLSEKIAKQFSTEYSNKTQIFVASHSFHFISLSDKNTTKYRVFRENGNLDTEVVKLNDSNSDLLSDELGVLSINNKLAELYTELSSEMQQISATKQALKEAQLPYLIFEGKTDNKLFSTAYQQLKGNPIETDFKLCEHLTSDNGCTIGSGARFINEFLFNHIAKTPINNKVIAIFDLDKMGVDEIKCLNRAYTRLDNSVTDPFFKFQHKTRKNIYAITLVAPNHRSKFFHKIKSEYCYISTELLFLDTEINVDNRHWPSLYDKTVFGFTGNKDAFADRIEQNKNSIDFRGFQPTLNLIEQILST
jgi:AAA15 family ATPase/GTPase